MTNMQADRQDITREGMSRNIFTRLMLFNSSELQKQHMGTSLNDVSL